MAPPIEVSVANEEAKFPTQQLFILGLCRLAEPIAFTSILAYIYVFVQDVRPNDEANAPFFAGLLVSAFALAEACTAMAWGSLSDRIGRKPVVLFGLAGTALSSLIFGFAKNYWIALLARVIGGLLNGNVAVMQTMVAEMCKRPEHEPKAYSVIPFVWSAGSILGAAMGGFLAQPAKEFPSTFPPDGIFGRYPYLLPNLIAAAYIVLAIFLGIFLLKETNTNLQSKPSALSDVPSALADEHTPLWLNPTGGLQTGEEQYPAKRRPSLVGTNMPLTTGTTVDLRRVSIVSVSTTGAIIPPLSALQQRRNSVAISEDDTWSSPWTREVVLLIVQLILTSFHTMAYGSLVPVFLVDEPARSGLDLHGGLGYTVRDVGTFMAMNGVAALFIQGVVFAPFVEKVGVWRSFTWLTILLPTPYVVGPFLTALSGSALPTGIYIDLFVNNFLSIIIYPCALILLKNAVPSLSMLGKVNGLAMAACSGARTFAPPLAGFFYSKGGSAAGWWSITIVAVIGGLLLYPIKPPRDGDNDEYE